MAANGLDHFQLVGDQHNGQPQLAVDLRQQLQDRRRGFRVQGAGGLIRQQVTRPGGQGPGDAHPLLLATGQLRRIGLGLVAKTHQFQQFQNPRAALAFAQAGNFQRHRDVVLNRARMQQVEALEDHADALALPAQLAHGQGAKVLAVHQDAPAAGPLQQVQAAQQGRLAGAAAPENAVHRPVGNRQRNPIQCRGLAFAVDLAKLLDLDHGWRSVTGITEPE